MKMWQPSKCAILVGLTLGLSFSKAEANQISILGGLYSLSAKTTTGEGTISNIGSYRFTYQYAFMDSLTFDLGYSMFMTDIIGGDMGFGPDLGFSYYPLTRATPKRYQARGVSVSRVETIRPYVGSSFHQRQFQSVASSYAGFSAHLGADWYIMPQWSLRTDLRYLFLRGPREAEASMVEVSVGASFAF